MQELYYISESATLTLIKDTGISETWTGVDSLITGSNSYEIIATSGSQELASFPINNTNIYYKSGITNEVPPTNAEPVALLAWRYTIINIEPVELANCSYSISSSTMAYSESGPSTALTMGVQADDVYTFKVVGSSKYDSYLYVGDLSVDSPTPEVGYSLVYISGSNQGVSASVYLSASHNYSVYMTIIGYYTP